MPQATDAPLMGQTTISVSDELADELYARKGRGESYEDVIWQLLEEESGDEPRDSSSPVEQTPPSEPADTRRDETETEPAEPLSLEDRLDIIDVPGSGEKEVQRREAVRAAVDYIQEHGGATPADLKDDVYPDHTGDYASGRSWWKNCVYPALRELAESDDRLEKADQSGRWSWCE